MSSYSDSHRQSNQTNISVRESGGRSSGRAESITSDDVQSQIRHTSFEEIDEESWNYGILFTRVFAILTVIVIIICISLQVIDQKFLIVAGIITGLLILAVILSYFNYKCLRRWHKDPQKTQEESLLNNSR